MSVSIPVMALGVVLASLVVLPLAYPRVLDERGHPPRVDIDLQPDFSRRDGRWPAYRTVQSAWPRARRGWTLSETFGSASPDGPPKSTSCSSSSRSLPHYSSSFFESTVNQSLADPGLQFCSSRFLRRRI